MKRFEIEGFSKYSFGLDGSVYSLISKKFLNGSVNKGGYLQFTLRNDTNIPKKLFQHQIVYKLFNQDYKLFQGNKMVVDHINGDVTDNHISNLRLISHRKNLSKERTIKSGLPVGVYFKKRKNRYQIDRYQSQIQIDNKNKHIGFFSTPEEASEAYQEELLKIKNN